MDKQEIYRILNEAYFSEECHEKDVLDHLPALLGGVKVFVDVGASLGQYTFFANKHIQGGQIFAIEADPVRFEELKENCRKWESESASNNKLTALHAAASYLDGKTMFFVTNSNVSGGLFKHNAAQAVDWHEIIVSCYRLDKLFGDRGPDLVKIDVEGGELRVLRGATAILREGKAKFLIEIHHWVDPEGQESAAELFTFLKSLSYYPVDFYGRTLFIPRNRKLYYKAKLKGFLRRLKGLARVKFASL